MFEHDDYLGTQKWHALVTSLATAFGGGDAATERAKMMLCDHGIWPLSIALDVELNGR